MPLYPLPRHLHPDFDTPGKQPIDPAIDWEHPLSRGLIACVVPSKGYLPASDLCGNPRTTDHTEQATVGRDSTGGYVAPIAPTTGNSGYSFPVTDTYTHFTTIEVNSANYNAVFGVDHNVPGSAPSKQVFCSTYYTGTALLVWMNTNPTNRTEESGNGPHADLRLNGVHTAALTVVDGVFTEYWQDGALARTIVGTTDNSTLTANRMKLGAQFIGYGHPTNNYQYNGYVWNRELSPQEHALLEADPYCFLKPANPVMYYVPAADGGISGTIAVTLDAFPAAGAGTSTDPVTGTTAVTLGVFQAAAAGSSIDFVTGNVAVTLDVFPASGAGTSTDNISGTVAVTLAEFNPTASGVVGDGVNGSIAATLGEFTPASAGLIAMTGDMVTTLEAFTSIANATVTDSPNGSVAAVLDLFVCAATGTGGTITETHYDGGDYYGRLYNKQFGETIQDAEKRYLIANGATPAANLADMWVELLVAAGYTGDLETMWRAWQANGATW